MIAQGDVCRASLRAPTGSEPGFRLPVVVIQGNAPNRSRMATAVCVPLTTNLRLAAAPGNLLLPSARTGLRRDCVANVSQVITLDRTVLEEPVGTLGSGTVNRLLPGLDIVLGRP